MCFAASAVYIPLASAWVAVCSLFVNRRATMHRLRRTISWYGKLLVACAWPFIRVKYRDLAPGEMPKKAIFICNHRSASDPCLLCCPPIEGVQIAKAWPLRLPLLGFIAKLAGYISIHELTKEEFYQQAGSLLDDQVALVAFPEGTRSGSTRMGQFNSLIFRLARENRASLIPLAIAGTENKPQKGSIRLKPGLVRVEKLPALHWKDYQDISVFKLKNQLRDILEKHLATIEYEDRDKQQ